MRARGPAERIVGAMDTRRRSDPRRIRAGMTVVEVLVAMMLLTIGLLGFAGSSALAVRTVSAAQHHRGAVQRAASRIAALSASACSGLVSGERMDPNDRYRERWRVGSGPAGIVSVEAHVAWVAAAGERDVMLRSAILC